MSITPLSAARIVGEVGLAGGTITGGCCAAKYSNGMSRLTSERENLKKENNEIHKEAEEVIKTYYMVGEYLVQQHRPSIRDIESEFLPFYSCSLNHASSTRRWNENRCTKEKMATLENKLNEKGITFSS